MTLEIRNNQQTTKPSQTKEILWIFLRYGIFWVHFPQLNLKSFVHQNFTPHPHRKPKLKTHLHHNEQVTNPVNSQYSNPKKIHKTKTQIHRKFTIPKPTMALIRFYSRPTSIPTATPQPRPPLDRLPKVANREWGMRERGTNGWWERNPRERAIDLTVDGQNQFKQKRLKKREVSVRIY